MYFFFFFFFFDLWVTGHEYCEAMDLRDCIRIRPMDHPSKLKLMDYYDVKEVNDSCEPNNLL